MDQVRDGLLYTKDHEWVAGDAAGRKVGITAYAVEQLGDITLVTLDVKPGDAVEAGKVFGTVESVKTLSDLYAPIGGTIVAVNAELDQRPELVNESCYDGAWMITIASDAAPEGLMDAAAYRAFLAQGAH
ncbi:MAG: glycine cleavage system protein GcvH [Polyangiaceae bacterium]|nr:glycine cleavage system protein GcvH [Polyangiaceae bacterium]